MVTPSGKGDRTKTISLEEFLANVPGKQSCAPVIVGPRSFGQSDATWEADWSMFNGREICQDNDNMVDKNTHVSPIMVAIAMVGDPTIGFQQNADALVHHWFVTTFKKGYQAARVPRKRPWPEFATSMRASFGFVDADLSTVSLVSGAEVATVESGRLVIPSSVKDKDFGKLVIDARSCKSIPLGEVCLEALDSIQPNHASHIRAIAQSLAMNHEGVSTRTLSSSIASRRAALDHFKHGARPPSGVSCHGNAELACFWSG